MFQYVCFSCGGEMGRTRVWEHSSPLGKLQSFSSFVWKWNLISIPSALASVIWLSKYTAVSSKNWVHSDMGQGWATWEQCSGWFSFSYALLTVMMVAQVNSTLGDTVQSYCIKILSPVELCNKGTWSFHLASPLRCVSNAEARAQIDSSSHLCNNTAFCAWTRTLSLDSEYTESWCVE